MSNDDTNPGELGAKTDFVIRIGDMGNGVLAMKPRILGWRSGDKVRWEWPGRSFRVTFKATDPSKPRPPDREVTEPDVIQSDDHGVAEATIHPKASDEYPYQVTLLEGKDPPEGHGALLVNVMMAVIIRGPVDPV